MNFSRESSFLFEQSLDQPVQVGEVGFPHIPFDDLAALVHKISGGRQMHIAPGFGDKAGVDDGYPEGSLAAFSPALTKAASQPAQDQKSGLNRPSSKS